MTYLLLLKWGTRAHCNAIWARHLSWAWWLVLLWSLSNFLWALSHILWALSDFWWALSVQWYNAQQNRLSAQRYYAISVWVGQVPMGTAENASERSVDYDERSVISRERSPNFAERSPNIAERSLNFCERSASVWAERLSLSRRLTINLERVFLGTPVVHIRILSFLSLEIFWKSASITLHQGAQTS